MRSLIVFNQLSLDGYFTDANGGMSWGKENNEAEFSAFTVENAKGARLHLSTGLGLLDFAFFSCIE